MIPTVTPIYAALLALLFVVLSARVILRRRTTRISLGPAQDDEMLKRMRVHANCAEYAPLALVLMLITELQGAPALALHILGASLLAGRILHAYGVSKTPQIMGLRIAGMILTFGVIIVSALGMLAHSLL